MIDENLVRHELSASERATILVRRRDIYNAIHNPLVGRGGDRKSDQVSEGQLIQTFADQTAAATGMSARTVYKQLERGEKVIAEAMGMIQGTKLDTTTYLDKIKGLGFNQEPVRRTRTLDEGLSFSVGYIRSFQGSGGLGMDELKRQDVLRGKIMSMLLAKGVRRQDISSEDVFDADLTRMHPDLEGSDFDDLFLDMVSGCATKGSCATKTSTTARMAKLAYP